MKQPLLERLAAHGQQHLLAFWDELSADEQRRLAEQIGRIDLDLIDRLYRGDSQAEDWAAVAARASAPPAFRLGNARNPFTPEQGRSRGEAALSAGKVGVILVAGGQGTRLGFDHPKGMFPIGPVSGATLFQVLFEKIIARARRHGARIPLYLMTSPATDAETESYLDEHERFGLPREDVKIFCQGTMPAIDAETGKLLLAEKGRLFESPDGHGGMLAALVASGALADIRRRGIEQLFYFQVDNPLVSVCDPQFIGYHVLSQSEMSSQVIAKRTSRDKVGNVVVVDGKLRIIEYSDLNPLADAIVERRAADGSPVFWAGSIAIHVFETEFLERVAGDAAGLPFHIAKKAVPYIDPSGRRVEPQKPNAIKFERFIFDLLPFARQGIVVEVDEAEVFAPVKNASGDPRDTRESVQAQMIDLHRRWLAAAGCRVAPSVPVEICPLFAQNAEELAARVPPGLTVTEPRYFC